MERWMRTGQLALSTLTIVLEVQWEESEYHQVGPTYWKLESLKMNYQSFSGISEISMMGPTPVGVKLEDSPFKGSTLIVTMGIQKVGPAIESHSLWEAWVRYLDDLDSWLAFILFNSINPDAMHRFISYKLINQITPPLAAIKDKLILLDCQSSY